MDKSNFQILFDLNVNEWVERKSNGSVTLSYLSWAQAWAAVKKIFPNATYEVRHWDGKPYLFDESLGYMCETSVTIDGQTHMMWLPVMDGANKAQKDHDYTYPTRSGEKSVVAATMFDINTTIMRCLVKNLAMFGLGLYIYAGEDIPQTEAQVLKDQLCDALAEVKSCKTAEELQEVVKKYPSLKDVKQFKDTVSFLQDKFSGVDFF